MSRSTTTPMVNDNRIVAAIDLGSNSFHMVVAKNGAGGLQTLAKVKQRVRLAAGFDHEMRLSDAVIEQALIALQDMRSVLDEFKPVAVRAVGTHSLRHAKNADVFLQKAKKVLGFAIDVIDGKEEARLIYAGIAHNHPGADTESRLVLDIGGGSTELVIGRGVQPILLDSMTMGCVTFEREYFSGGELNAERFAACIHRCHELLQSCAPAFRQLGWRSAIGSSGTVQAVAEVLKAQGLHDGLITLPRLHHLRADLIERAHAVHLDYQGLSPERRAIFAPGVAILLACFETLAIDTMHATGAALREGLLQELVAQRAVTG